MKRRTEAGAKGDETDPCWGARKRGKGKQEAFGASNYWTSSTSCGNEGHWNGTRIQDGFLEEMVETKTEQRVSLRIIDREWEDKTTRWEVIEGT